MSADLGHFHNYGFRAQCVSAVHKDPHPVAPANQSALGRLNFSVTVSIKHKINSRVEVIRALESTRREFLLILRVPFINKWRM